MTTSRASRGFDVRVEEQPCQQGKIGKRCEAEKTTENCVAAGSCGAPEAGEPLRTRRPFR
jgi:hypothetical protein